VSDERRLVPLSEIPEEPIEGLWPDRIFLGAITIIDGDPEQGKSHVTYDLAARVTVGRPMPLCKGKSKKGGVVLIEAEDGMSSVVKPTIQAAGGDVSRIRVYDRERFMEHALLLPKDMELIKTAVKEVKARLVVIDPLPHFLAGNPNSDVSVRRALGPLATLAEKEQFAVVVIRHHNKGGSGNPLYRGSGSIGIIGLARSAYWVASDPISDDQYRHILVPTKNNLSTATSLCYRTVKQGNVILVEWLGESSITAKDLVIITKEEDPSELARAIDFLKTLLEEHGPMTADGVFNEAKYADVAKRTLLRAKRVLHVKRKKQTGVKWGKWFWCLPSSQDSVESNDAASKLEGETSMAAVKKK
jgi:hypothetical protein